MAKVKKGDFIQIKFVGRIKENNMIFDLNDEEVAKAEDLYDSSYLYKPLTVCVGQKDVVKGLDDALVNKEVGKKFSIDLSPEEAFGKRDAKLLQLVSSNKFKENKMNPFPGMQVTVNNMSGVVKTVGSGRVMVDFNHPLAGKDLKYDVNVLSLVEDDTEKVKSFAEMYLGLRDPKVEVKAGVANFGAAFPAQLVGAVEKKLKERIPSLKKVEFKEPVQK